MEEQPVVVPVAPVERPTVPVVSSNSYKVVKGDCLWNIAKKLLGDGFLWTKIYDANKATIKNPNLIFVNQELVIPGK